MKFEEFSRKYDLKMDSLKPSCTDLLVNNVTIYPKHIDPESEYERLHFTLGTYSLEIHSTIGQWFGSALLNKDYRYYYLLVAVNKEFEELSKDPSAKQEVVLEEGENRLIFNMMSLVLEGKDLYIDFMIR
jgi:hypothetical protein